MRHKLLRFIGILCICYNNAQCLGRYWSILYPETKHSELEHTWVTLHLYFLNIVPSNHILAHSRNVFVTATFLLNHRYLCLWPHNGLTYFSIIKLHTINSIGFSKSPHLQIISFIFRDEINYEKVFQKKLYDI